MVYLFLADGFEETEAIVPLDILRRAGIDAVTVAITPSGNAVTGAHGITVMADMHCGSRDTVDAEMLILPGGMPGTTNLQQSGWVTDRLRAAATKGVYLAAICAAPSILGGMGLLSGKRATCYPGYEPQLEGATVTGEQVVVDGRFITAKGAGAAADFGFALVSILKDVQTAAKIRSAMQFI